MYVWACSPLMVVSFQLLYFTRCGDWSLACDLRTNSSFFGTHWHCCLRRCWSYFFVLIPCRTCRFVRDMVPRKECSGLRASHDHFLSITGLWKRYILVPELCLRNASLAISTCWTYSSSPLSNKSFRLLYCTRSTGSSAKHTKRRATSVEQEMAAHNHIYSSAAELGDTVVIGRALSRFADPNCKFCSKS